MLKYRINRNAILSDQDIIPITRVEFVDNNPYNIQTKQNTNIKVLCYSDKRLDNLKESDEILSFDNISLTEEIDVPAISSKFFSNKFKVTGVNSLNGMFSFEMPKFMELGISKILQSDNGYSYFYLNDYHFFSKDVNEVNRLWIYYNDNFIEFSEFDVVDNTIIKIKHKQFENLGSFGNIYSFITNYTETSNIHIHVYREAPFFSNIDNYSVYYNNPKCIIPIGLTNTNQINLQKEQNLIDYMNDAKSRAINSITDMEKDVYYPVYYKKDENNVSNVNNIIKIKFNLHFREHDGDYWLTENDSYWNGVERDTKGKLKLSDEYFSFTNKEKQSDLLKYLDFSDSDVRYQKSRLKKSFIRLSFYDSMNIGDQNLLAYSTIYVDSGELFSKYVRYIEQTPYRIVSKNDDEYVVDSEDLTGIKVSREYGNKDENNKEVIFTKYDNPEEYRLSSQITVTDRYNSDDSSEGFYLYLYKDLFKNLTEDEKKNGLVVYMKVEFNHAKYGRTVPFMMPYWDMKKWEDYTIKDDKDYNRKNGGIKSFEQIVDDWNEYERVKKDQDNTKQGINKEGEKFEETTEEFEKRYNEIKPTNDGGYGALQYTKFSYIRFIIKYDENENRYIYYLDDETYGDTSSNIEDDNTLLLNLYEAKMI